MKSPLSLLKETGYELYVDEDTLSTIPRTSEKKKVEVFKLNRYMSNEEVRKEYKSRGLVPASLEDILSIEKEYDNIFTLWDDNCCLMFNRWDDERSVDCGRSVGGWGDRWFASGVVASGKSSELHSETSPVSLEMAITLVREAGYEVTKLTLAQKFREYYKDHCFEDEEPYWSELEAIAEAHYSDKK